MSSQVDQSLACADHAEVAMFVTLGNVLRRGSFELEDVDTLAAAAGDASVEVGARRLAWSAIEWLAQARVP